MARYQPVPIRLGSVDSKSNVVRDFGRAGDVRNVDIEKTNEISRRRGYLRRLTSQMSGPVRFLHSYGGLCGRFFSYADGGGLITVGGTQGSGGLRETLDLDTQYPVDPADVGDPTEIGSGEGNAGNTETPGGGGATTTDDGVLVISPGMNRERDDVSTARDSIDDDPDSADFSFLFTASLDVVNTTTLTWRFENPGDDTAKGYVEIYRLYGSGTAVSDGTLIKTTSNLDSTFADTVDEYQDDISYQILFFLDGVDTYGPFSSSIDQQVHTYSVTAPASADIGTAFNLTIQGVHWDATNDTSYIPSGDINITISGSNSISPTTTSNSGWSSGAKTVSCTISGSTVETGTITVTDPDSGSTGNDSLSVTNFTLAFSDDFNRADGTIDDDVLWEASHSTALSINSNIVYINPFSDSPIAGACLYDQVNGEGKITCTIGRSGDIATNSPSISVFALGWFIAGIPSISVAFLIEWDGVNSRWRFDRGGTTSDWVDGQPPTGEAVVTLIGSDLTITLGGYSLTAAPGSSIVGKHGGFWAYREGGNIYTTFDDFKVYEQA